jgi:hypothetical protein
MSDSPILLDRKKLTPEQVTRVRELWKEQVRNYVALRATVMKVILHPLTTAEHVMPAKQALAEVYHSMHKTQHKLESLGLLRFHDRRMPD